MRGQDVIRSYVLSAWGKEAYASPCSVLARLYCVLAARGLFNGCAV